MKFHPIFHKPYQIWWAVLAIICIIKFSVFGFPTMYENENYGYIFWTIGTLFTGLIFGSVFYLVYRLFSKKWDNKIYMILVSIFTIIVLATYKLQDNKGWTPLQEKQLRLGIIKQSDMMGLSQESKLAYIDCVIGKFKKEYPNGILSMSEEDAQSAGKRIGKECFKGIDKVDMKWTKESEELLMNYYINSKDFKDIPIERKQNFARCVVDELKIKYPEGLTGKVPKNVWNEIAEICAKNLQIQN